MYRKLLMKVLSVKQPFANMIISGEKTIETRTWKTGYRGFLYIHASGVPKIKPYGAIIGLVELTDCRLMRPRDWEFAKCPEYPDAYAWVMKVISKVKPPIKIKGKLNIWDWDGEGDIDESRQKEV